MIVVIVIKDGDGNVVEERVVYGLDSAVAGEPIDMDEARHVVDILATTAESVGL